MTPPNLADADRLAQDPPTGRVALDPDLLDALRARLGEHRAADPAVDEAVRAGEDVAHAIAAGCPPQFHPGVGAEHQPALATARTALGLGAAAEVAVPAGADALFLDAIGCEVVRDGAGG